MREFGMFGAAEQERFDFLRSLVTTEITANSVGVHGTSIEAFQYYIKTGNFPGWTQEPYEEQEGPQ